MTSDSDAPNRDTAFLSLSSVGVLCSAPAGSLLRTEVTDGCFGPMQDLDLFNQKICQ